MYNEIHANHVLHKKLPDFGDRYRQIIVIELTQFQVRIFEGDVILLSSQIVTGVHGSELQFHVDLGSALRQANYELEASLASGWTLYP